MILAFELSMPRSPSWNGRWSGEGNRYIILKTFRSKKDKEKAVTLKGNYTHLWEDGWMARVTVYEVDSSCARSLRKQSKGFCGYDWMVKSICEHGEIKIERCKYAMR